MENLVIPEIKPAVFSGQKVLSTIQLAKIFKCKRNNITDNFRNHKAEFIKDVDYFHPNGDELQTLKQADQSAQNNLRAFSKYSTNTYLWTESGVEKLAKIIGTDEAKLIYTSLKFGYFQAGNNSLPPTRTKNFPQLSTREKIELLEKWIELCTDEKLRDDLIKTAFALLNL